MLRSTPPGEDPVQGTRAIPVSIAAAGTPPGEDGTLTSGELENAAGADAENPDGIAGGQEHALDFLDLTRQAETQAMLYVDQANRRAWSDSLRAFHNDHFIGSKYTKPDFRARSKLFVPKTRAAVRKDNAAVAASLFNSIDAITCLPGNESDRRQKGAAAVMTELVNYRTDRTSGKAAFPWFLVSLGARQDALLTGICLSKQYWKQEFRKAGKETVSTPDEDGVHVQRTRDVYTLDIDRPDMLLIPPENVVIDPAADWTNPAQSASFIIVKYPMTVEEVRKKQAAPINPWLDVAEGILQTSQESATNDMAAIRRAREGGLDRFDEAKTGTTFKIVWVYEVFMRVEGEDWTFYCVGSKAYLTKPRPTRDVYPEQYGERPLAMGYGSLEAHRIFPMSPVESWQPLQNEVNDLRNLRLDATKQNVMPIAKVVRGRQIDLDQLKRRSTGSAIMVQDKDDVTFEGAPPLGEHVVAISHELEIEFDDLAGVQNYGNVQQSNALGKTLGGLKLAAGSANALQEFDIRVWIETWATPALAQIVRLEQYYENDVTVLGLCAERAQLFQKHGIDKINDEFLEQEISIRVSVGLGAGDPQQRLAKFQSAASIVAPMLAQTKEFQTGQVELDWEAISTEVFGGAGYRDGGRRFFKINDAPPQNPMQDLQTQALQAKIDKDRRTGAAATMAGLAALAKAALGKRELESEVADMLLDHQQRATDMGFQHAHIHNNTHLAALEHGHRHGLAIADHRRAVTNDARQAANSDREFAHRQQMDTAQTDTGGDEEQGATAQAQPEQNPKQDMQQMLMSMLQQGQLEFTRDPHTNRISGLRLAGRQGYQQPTAS